MENQHRKQINEIIENILYDEELEQLNEMATIGFVVDKHLKQNTSSQWMTKVHIWVIHISRFITARAFLKQVKWRESLF